MDDTWRKGGGPPMKQKKRPSVLRIVQRKKNQKPKTRNAVKDEEEMNVVDINRRPQREREGEKAVQFSRFSHF